MAKRKKKSNVKFLTIQEAQDLLAHELAKSLWIALITGSEVEDNVFQTLKETGISFVNVPRMTDIKPVVIRKFH